MRRLRAGGLVAVGSVLLAVAVVTTVLGLKSGEGAAGVQPYGFGGVVGTVAQIAFVAVGFLIVVFRTPLGPVTGENDVAVAASTLAVAALFVPARRRIPAFIDRRFYRSRYDVQRTLARFATRLRDEVDPDAVSRELRAVISTVQSRYASIWLVGSPR